MTTHESTIDIDAASEGMILAQNLLDSGGKVLLPEGASLSASSLASLRRRGIEQLCIQVVAEASEADQAAVEAERARQCQRLQHLFRRSAGVGASGQLLEHLAAYRKGA